MYDEMEGRTKWRMRIDGRWSRAMLMWDDEDLRGRAHSCEHLRMRLARLPLTKSARYCRRSASLPHTIRCLFLNTSLSVLHVHHGASALLLQLATSNLSF